jgi:CHAT domain-containing protein/tetratricopeptide (TPR) repeat protein
MLKPTGRRTNNITVLFKAALVFGLSACACLALALPCGHFNARVTAQDASGSAARGTQVPQLQASGPRVAREIGPGENHLYEINLELGQFARVVVKHAGGDVGGTLCRAGGGECVEFRSRRRGPTPISIVAPVSGIYRLEVRTTANEEQVVNYEVGVEVVRQASDSDRNVVEAERLFTEGERLRAEWITESSRAAVEKYEAARELWRKTGDRGSEADALLSMAGTLHALNEPRRALALYESALSLGRAARESRHEADALNGIGSAHLTLGENEKALRYFRAALTASRRGGHRHGEAQSLNNTGEAYNALGDMRASLGECLKSLDIWRELKDRQGQALALLNVGYAHSSLSNIQDATDSLKQSLNLWRGIRNPWGTAHALTALGHLKSKLGEKQEALDLYRQATPLFRTMGDKVGTAFVLNGMGYVYDELGEKESALDYHNEALQLFHAADYRDGEAGALLRLGEVYYSKKDNLKALEFFRQALAVYRDLSFKLYESYVLRDIGMVYEALGDREKALSHYRRALATNRIGGDRRWQAHTLNNIAHVYETGGDRRKALGYHERALALNRATGDRFGAAATIYNIARLKRDAGQLEEAREHSREVLEMAESLRIDVTSQTLRASYFASAHQYYELYVDVLMRLHERRPTAGFDAAAFEASERARARSLVETLKEVQANIRQGADPALLERQRVLQRELSAKAERRMQLTDGEEAQSLAREIDRLTIEYDQIGSQIKSASPNYASLVQPQPLGLKEIQQQVLEEDVLLLEYFLGEERSYLWAVTKNGITAHALPRRAEVEDSARRLYQVLITKQSTGGASPASQTSPEDEYRREAGELSRVVLGPVAGQLSARRLLVVADGALQYIPFQALTSPLVPGQTGEAPPLMLTHEIINQPSASSLAILRGAVGQREPARKSVAIFADPVFEKDDPRVLQTGGTEELTERLPAAELTRAVRDMDIGGNVPRLLASQEEAEAIAASVPGGDAFKATGFEASRSTVMSANLGQYRIVHFATHGLLDNRHPELSGVVLSLFDEQGAPQDGFLQLHDIYNLKLPVDVVVLSACNTGLGKDVRGEGLIGLTRGFMYAGAASVVASLWQVNDEATAELMGHFYKAMLTDKLAPSAALREAQIAMWKQRRWRSPYFWAAFTLQGEYSVSRAAVQSERVASVWTAGGIVAATLLASALMSCVWFVMRRRGGLS